MTTRICRFCVNSSTIFLMRRWSRKEFWLYVSSSTCPGYRTPVKEYRFVGTHGLYLPGLI